MSSSPKKDDLEAVRQISDILKEFDQLDQERIIRWAWERLGQTGSPKFLHNPPAGGNPAPSDGNATPTTTPPGNKDLRSFVESKAPGGDNHFAATVAYYYAFIAPESDKKESIDQDTLMEAARLANRRRPKRPQQVLVNAHAAGFLDRVSSGNYSINSVGENLVAMGPAGSGSEEKRSQKKGSKKKSRASKKGS